MSEKTCTICGEIRPRGGFSRDRRLNSGFRSRCKLCSSKHHAGWVSRNREKKAAMDRSYKKLHPEMVGAYRRKGARVRRDREVSAGESFSTEHERLVNNHWGHKCAVCGRTAFNAALTIDHWMPLCKGFALSLSNAVPMCRSCNSKKGSKLPHGIYDKEFVARVEARILALVEQKEEEDAEGNGIRKDEDEGGLRIAEAEQDDSRLGEAAPEELGTEQTGAA